jgi:GAF domain-containing protein
MIDKYGSDVAGDGHDEAVRHVLAEVATLTGMGFVAVAQIADTRWIAFQILDQIDFGMSSGDELRVSTTICNDIRESGNAVVIGDVSSDSQWNTHPAPLLYGFRSYASVPIILSDGSFYGTLCALDPQPRMLAVPGIVPALHAFADRVADILSQRRLPIGGTSTGPAMPNAFETAPEQF